jgi:DNA-binding NarL/FixJ family response regulator
MRCRALVARAQALAHGDGRGLNDAVNGLPVRARETLMFLLQGIAVPDIAHRMQIGPNTVYTYVKRIYADLEVSSRAALFARCQGLDRAGARAKPGLSVQWAATPIRLPPPTATSGS